MDTLLPRIVFVSGGDQRPMPLNTFSELRRFVAPDCAMESSIAHVRALQRARTAEEQLQAAEDFIEWGRKVGLVAATLSRRLAAE